MASITFSDLKKKYGSFLAIPDLSLDIADGQFVILVGPSGCGKSTLLRMLAGLEAVTGGEVRIDGKVVNDLMPRQRDIAMVFQSYALYPHMTVGQNMGFSLKLDKRPKEEIERRVRDAAEILALETLLDRKPAQLSGGQRQRVAMGRAIVRDPKVFLFDEPLSNLDAKLRVQMRAEIKALHERLKTTIVYVTHDQVEAMTMADRIVVMNAGRIEQDGSPLELYDKPVNRFVAEFLGSPVMNMLKGQWAGGANGHGELTLADGQKVAVPAKLDGIANGSEILMGIRPQHMRVAGDEEDGIKVRIKVVEPTGTDTYLIGNAGADTITCELGDRVSLHSGEMVKLAFDSNRLHFFDVETGERHDPVL